MPEPMVEPAVALPPPTAVARPWLATYPPGVPPTYAIPSVPLGRLLDDAVRDVPGLPAVATDHEVLDHATLAGGVDAVGRALITAGVRPGDVVAVGLPIGPTLPVVLWALWRLGAAVLPDHLVGPNTDDIEVVAPAVVLATRRMLHVWRDRPGWAPRVTVRVTGDEWPPDAGTPWWRRWRRDVGDATRRSARPGRDPRGGLGGRGALGRGHRDELRLDELLADPAGGVLPLAPRPDAPALVVPAPLGGEVRVLDHAALVAAAFQARLWIPDVHAGKERVLVTDGIAVGAGLTFGLLATTLAAGTLLLADRPDADVLERRIERDRPTILVADAARLVALAATDPPRHDLTSLRVIWADGPLPPEVAEELGRRTAGARVRHGASLAAGTVTTHGQPVYGRVVAGAMGVPVTDTAAVVVDRRDPTVLRDVGEVGRLAVQGPQVGRPLHAELPGGWWLTDEVVTVDAQGWFHRLGRLDEVVERDGSPVVLPTVEAVLVEHPAVRRAGVAHDPDHDRLVAAVVLRRRGRPSPEELLAHCRSQLDVAAVPDRVVAVEELPDTEAGGLDRPALRALLAAGDDT